MSLSTEGSLKIHSNGFKVRKISIKRKEAGGGRDKETKRQTDRQRQKWQVNLPWRGSVMVDLARDVVLSAESESEGGAKSLSG